jgi:hypothetical protein
MVFSQPHCCVATIFTHNKALGHGLYWNWAYVQLHLTKHFIDLANQGKDIVFRFIIEYNSLMDFAP